MNNDTGRLWSARWLYLGFVLTGIGTTLLGCLLPNLITTWHMNDSRAGMLFAAQFAGASFGAAFVSHDYFKSIVRGYVLLIAGAGLIAYFADSSRSLLFLIFGLGLGLTMTATSMLTGSTFPMKRGAALSLLNACWCFGALLCPMVASLWTTRWPAAKLFLALAVAFAVVVLLNRRVHSALASDFSDAGVERGQFPLMLILSFALVAFLYVGVEASVSGWMMAYVGRLTAAHNPLPPIAVSCFWIALLCGRAIAPVVLRRISEAKLLIASTLGAFASVLLLVLNYTPLGIVLSATSSGLAFGPIYPLCLAKVLSLAKDSPRTKWIFGISGLGGALLPWLTGELSANNESLSIGLFVPLCALGIMLVLELFIGLRSSLLGATKEVCRGRRISNSVVGLVSGRINVWRRERDSNPRYRC
jgi:FHS family glucose/mannose:H+ symporter-like MFS transporter